MKNHPTARSINVIETTLSQRGEGSVRTITQYWTDDGCLLAEVDPDAVPLTPEFRAQITAAIERALTDAGAGEAMNTVFAALCYTVNRERERIAESRKQ